MTNMDSTGSERTLDLRWTAWFGALHVLGIWGIYYTIVHASAATILCGVILFFLCHLSISCGAHRLYAHLSYSATTALQLFYIFFFSGTFQGPLIWWFGKHRLHHKEVDTPRDPHSPLFGFIWAHMGWMCTQEGIAHPPTSFMRCERGEARLVVWQLKYHWPLTVVAGVVLPVAVCGFGWGDWEGGFWVCVVTRILFQSHFTWSVNSFCHTWGTVVPGAGTARNIALLGIFTVGESYHGNHHKHAKSWKLGSRWYDLDPSKWFIQLCFWLRLAGPRKKVQK